VGDSVLVSLAAFWYAPAISMDRDRMDQRELGSESKEWEGNEEMPKATSALSSVHIRWMIRRDMPSVLGIESASFEFPWTEDEFIRCLRQRDCIGMVAEWAERVVGFMIYELHRTRIHILSFAVHPDHRRQAIGTAMMEKLASKLSYQRRNRIVLEVRETNLEAQLFFRSLGFRATGVLRNFYEDSTEDAFLMQYRTAEIEEFQTQNASPWERRTG
jgi:ribosomal-protein-alanine N-acetyltransferase